MAVSNPVIQYGVNFVVGVVTPKNAFKTLIAANKPLVLIDAALKQYTKSVAKLTPLISKSVAANFAWKDAVFPIGLVNTALNRLTLSTRQATNLIAGELRGLVPNLMAAFNPFTAIQSITALRPLLVPIIQQTTRLGSSWESTTALVVDNARQTGILSSTYATLAAQVAKFAKSEPLIAAITTSSIELAQATGLLPAQLAPIIDNLAQLTAITRLSATETKEYNQALTAATVKLPVTVEYLNLFTTANASLIKSNQLTIEQVTAYGTAFEQLGVKATKGGSVFQKLINIIQTPGDLSAKGITGFEQLGFSIEELTNLTAGEGGLNNALQVVLERIQGISNTNPSAAIQALSSLLGEDSDRGAGAQSIIALANNLGQLNSSMALLSDTAGNAALSEELLAIAAQADPVGNLMAAFQGLSETWGTVLQPLILSIATHLTTFVNGLSQFIAGSRDLLTGVIGGFVWLSRILDNTLKILKPLLFYWTVYNATAVTAKLIAIGLANVTKFLLVKNLFGLAVVTGFVSRQFNLLYVFMASKFLPLLQTLAVESLNALPTAIWVSFVNLMKALPGLVVKMGTAMVNFGKTALVAIRSAYFALAPFLPLIVTTTLTVLALRAAWLTFAAVTAKAGAIRDRIKNIDATAESLQKNFTAIGINADGSLSKTDSLFKKVTTAANDFMEAVRDNASIFEHIGNAIGNSQLASFKFATQAEASANRAAVAYGDLLTKIDSFGQTYNQVVAKLRENPTDYQTLEAGNSMLEILREQKKSLEAVEVTKDQSASKTAYLKSLDQQIRYLSKLSVGNDELKNSIDQADVSLENLQQTLDNLRTKVSDARSKEVEGEISALEEAAAQVEETEQAKLEAVEEQAKKAFDSQEKQIQRGEQLEDRSIARQRANEDRAIEKREAAEDRAIEKRQAAEDKALEDAFNSREKSIEKREALEDKAIEKRQAAEDKALEKQQAAEDKALARQQENEDKAIEKQYAAIDKAIEKRQALEDKALEKRQAAEDKAIEDRIAKEDEAAQQVLDAKLKALEEQAAAEEEATTARLEAELNAELAQIDTLLAAREQLIQSTADKSTKSLELQQLKAQQAIEAAFNSQQRQIDTQFETRSRQQEIAHKQKLQAAEDASELRRQQIEDRFNTAQIDKALKSVEARKAKELSAIDAREATAFKEFERRQQLDSAETPEERDKLAKEFQEADKLEAQKQAIKDKYDAERKAKEDEAAKAAAALEAEKAKKEEEAAKAKKEEEEKAAAIKAKLDAEAEAAKEKLELEKEAAKAARQAEYDKQQEASKLAFEEQINTVKLEAEAQLEKLRDEAETKRAELRAANEAKSEEARAAQQEKLEAAKAELTLKAEADKEQRDLKREADKEQRELKREADKEQRDLKREAEREQLVEQRELARQQLEDQREAQREQLTIAREDAAAQRQEQRELAKAARDEQREQAREARQEQFDAAKAAREEQREKAKEARDNQREQAAYQRQIAREDEDYQRQLKREEEATKRQEAFEAEKEKRQEAFDKAAAERKKALDEQVAKKQADLERELEVIKLQTQEAIEASYGKIVSDLKASAEAIAAAARASNAASAPQPSPGKRYKGGTVTAGLPYWVGENRRTGKLTPDSELFIPRSSGYVANASQVWSMISAANKLYHAPFKVSVGVPANSSSSATSFKPILTELNSIRADVAKLAKTVNHRTNELQTKKHPLASRHYEIH